MGLSEGQLANFNSAAEGSTSLTFPAQSSILNEIPLFLKFICVEYSMNSLFRGGLSVSKGNVGNVKAYINVPAPAKLVNQTAMRYKQDENEFFQTTLQKAAETRLAFATFGLGSSSAAGTNAGSIFSDIAKRTARSFGQLIETDFTETILQSGSKRSFVISLYLPCLNLEDSLMAAKISRAFEALALPTLIGAQLSAVQVGAQFHVHPPMWFFNMGKLGGFGDIDWTSQPQASVLTNVAVSRTALDATSFTALDLNIKPIAYSITLNFQEIETAFRDVAIGGGGGGGPSTKIVSRSGALKGSQAGSQLEISNPGGGSPSGGSAPSVTPSDSSGMG